MKGEIQMDEVVNKPVMAAYRRHAVMCAGKSCGENMPLLKKLKEKVAAADLDVGERAVRVNRAGCLGICQSGPIMVVHPEGVWYYDLDEAKLDRIVDEHFAQDKPVEALMFHNNEVKA